MIRFISIAVLSLVLAGSATPWSGESKSGLICTLTGKEIRACCCQLKDGQLYCPLANKTIQTCCCKSEG